MSLLFGGMALATTGIVAYNDINKKRIILRKQKKEFKNKFKQFMEAINKENKLEQTFEMLKYIPKNYGNDAIISIPIGYNVGDLIKLTPSLEMAYNANVVIEPSSTKNSAYMRVHYVDYDISEEDEIRFKWYKCMNNIKEARNSVDETFNIKSIKEIKDFNDKKCGYQLEVSIPSGIDYAKITSNENTIKNTLKAKRIFINYNQDTNTIIIKSILIPIADDLKFKPIKTQSVTEMYIGMCYDYNPVILHFQILSHLMYTGMTNTGKTVALLIGLTNHIYWYPDKEWELYLAQISHKKDLAIFKDVKQCRYYADDLDKVYSLFKYLYRVYEERNNKFIEYFEKHDVFIADIYDWNKYNPHNKMREIYVASDEFSSYQPDSADNKHQSDIKPKCLALLLKLFKEARNAGIHVLCSLQRPDKDSLDPKIKQSIGNIISFKQPNIASSLTVLGDDSAFYLAPQREAIVEANERYLMKTLYLTKEDIMKYIKPSIDKSHKNYINIDEDVKEDNSKNEEDKKADTNTKQRKRHEEYLKKKQEQENNKKNNYQLPPSCVMKK